MKQAAKSPCAACPWRVENHGKRHPSGWYRRDNLRRLWQGLKRGEQMTCHPTDPRNPVTEADVAAGYRPAPEHAETRECAGAVILVQREVHLFNEMVEADPKNGVAAYRAQRRRGMTTEGLMVVAMRAVTTWPGDVPMRRDHNLNEPVSNGDAQLAWTPRTEGKS